MRYFENFVEAPSSSDLAPVKDRAYATEGPKLSFDQLDDRSFEVLTYRLKSKQAASTQDRVTLMQGVGERGRDVLSYSSDGQLKTITQCKLLRERLSYPDLLRELLKLAIHRFLDPGVISTGVTYEIWAPGGFTERAAQLVDTWPQSWTEENLRLAAEAVIREYAAFKALSWGAVRESVLQFASLISLKKISDVDISVLVRGASEIFDDFFIAKRVVELDVLRRELSSILADVTSTGSVPIPPVTTPVAGTPASAATPELFRAPPPPSAFTRRESILRTARNVAAANRIVVIAGAGGIGKSAVASCLARNTSSTGIRTYWLDGTHLQQQLEMLAYTLGVPWGADNVQPLEEKLEALGANIVIDGLTFTPDVRGIPRPTSKLSIVITSRERGIVPLLPHAATLLDVSVLSQEEARVFLKRSIGVPFPWSDAEIDRAALNCGYLPLALVLLVSALRKKMTTCEELLNELISSPLATLDSNATTDQPGIESTFALAIARLSPAERTALVALSVCAPDTWVDVVAFASKQPKKSTDRALAALEAVSLVERHPSLQLWTMHVVVRFLCLKQSESLTFALRHDVSAMRQVEMHQAPEDWAIVEANLGEIFVAVERLTRLGLAEEVGATVRLLIPHLRERGLRPGRTRIIQLLTEQLLSQLPKKSMSRAYFVGQLGICVFQNGDREGGKKALEQSLKLYKALGSKSGELSTLGNMAKLYEVDGRLDLAAKRFRQAADGLQASLKTTSKLEKPERRRQSVTARLSLARVEAKRGNTEGCLKQLDAILRASTNMDLRDMHARALAYRARILAELKRYNDSFEVGRQAVRELQEVGLASELLQVLLQLAETALVAAHPHNALQAAEHATTLAERMDDWENACTALALQACALLCMGKDQEASRKGAAARGSAKRTSDPQATVERIGKIEARVKNSAGAE